MQIHLKAIFIAIILVLQFPFSIANTSSNQWVWETGNLTTNTTTQLKSNNGTTTYGSTQNPFGANVKINQNATTQPPTIIIKNADGGAFDSTNFFDDPEKFLTSNCWIFSNGLYSDKYAIGRGLLTSGLFTGHISTLGTKIAGFDFAQHGLSNPGAVNVYTGTFMFRRYPSIQYNICGTDDFCAWSNAVSSFGVVLVKNLSVGGTLPCPF
ncbi:MAG: hypothetical protein K2X63_05425 [Burkholderiaceae bacterium]|nr:hypothetical protein [Burkholderiaceae bacterium]